MRTRTAALAAALALCPVACGGPPAAKPPAPLSVADWKALPPEQKYTPETLERLKEGDPSLQTAEGWEAFQRSVVAPTRKKDIPNGKSR